MKKGDIIFWYETARAMLYTGTVVSAGQKQVKVKMTSDKHTLELRFEKSKREHEDFFKTATPDLLSTRSAVKALATEKIAALREEIDLLADQAYWIDSATPLE